MYVYTHMHIYTHTYTCFHFENSLVEVDLDVHMCVDIHTRTHTCIYMYMYTHIYVFTHTHIPASISIRTLLGLISPIIASISAGKKKQSRNQRVITISRTQRVIKIQRPQLLPIHWGWSHPPFVQFSLKKNNNHEIKKWRKYDNLNCLGWYPPSLHPIQLGKKYIHELNESSEYNSMRPNIFDSIVGVDILHHSFNSDEKDKQPWVLGSSKYHKINTPSENHRLNCWGWPPPSFVSNSGGGE